jgi:hypothetical protein
VFEWRLKMNECKEESFKALTERENVQTIFYRKCAWEYRWDFAFD